ncbi:MAG: hypothetical protein R3B92_04770, partial [Patescibacteria group bacterium]
DVVDVNCTDCLNATEIEDIYLLNTGDTATGTYSFSSGSVTVDNILLDANTIAATNDSGISIVDNANNGIFVEDGGNVGIGTTAPNSVLHVNGIATIQNDSALDLPNQLTIRGDTNTNNRLYMGYNTTADYGSIQAITEGTAYRNLILNAGGANVGVGTTNPSYKLDVNGQIRSANNTSAHSVLLGQTATNTGSVITASGYAIQEGVASFTNSNGGSVILGRYNANVDNQFTGTSIESGAQSTLGITNTFNPSTGTNVQNTLLLDPTINSTGGTNTFRGIYYNPTLTATTGTTNIAFQNTTGNVLLGTTSGNVGIGVGMTSPTKTLDVYGTFNYKADSLGNGQVQLTSNNSIGNLSLLNSSGTTIMQLLNAGDNRLIGVNNADFTFYTNNTEKLRIEAAGNVGIGSTNPSALFNVGNQNQFAVNSSGYISSIGGVAHTISDSSGNLNIASVAASDLLLTGADDIIFDDAQISGTIQLSDTDGSFVSGDTGIIDAINTAYNAATGGAGSIWSLNSGVIAPTDLTYDLGIGGSTPATAGLYFDESAELLTLTNTTSGLSFLVNDQASDSTPFAIDASGSVGIGTTAPQRLLHVGTGTIPGPAADTDADIYSSGGIIVSAGKYLSFDDNFAVHANIKMNPSLTGAEVAFEQQGYYGFNFITRSNTSSLAIKGDTGYIGLGTTNPTSKLTLETTSENAIRFTDGGTLRGLIGIASTSGQISTASVAEDLVVRGENGIHLAAGDANTDLFVSSTGYVGIGTTAPTATLQIDTANTLPLAVNVSGSRQLTFAADTSLGLKRGDTYNRNELRFQDANNTGIWLGTGSAQPSNYLRSYNGSDLRLGTNDVDRITINTSGYVGVGTTTPAAQLHVQADDINVGMSLRSSTFEPALQFCSSSACNYISMDNGLTDNLYLGGTVNALGGASPTITVAANNGNVGIGTTAPAQKLDIANGNVLLDKAYYVAWGDSNDSIRVEDTPAWFPGYNNVNTFNIFQGAWVFRDSQSGTIRATLLADTGYLGIGTTNPGYELELAGDFMLSGNGGSNAIYFGGSTSNSLAWTGSNLQVQTGGSLQIFDPTGVYGQSFTIYDGTFADSVAFSHDGTDFNIDATNTTDINITGADVNLISDLNIRATSGADQSDINFITNSGSYTGLMQLDQAGNFVTRQSQGSMYYDFYDNVYYRDNSAALAVRMTIDGSGNLGVGANADFTVSNAGNITKLGNIAHTISNSSGNLNIASVATSDLLLTGADDIIFDDAQISGTIQLSDTDGSFLSGDTGIIDAINTAYSSDAYWNQASGVVFPTSFTYDLAVGGSTPATAPLYFDESAELLTLTNTTSGLSFLVNDQANDTTPFAIAADGNVGIGTTAPGARMTIATPNTSAGLQITNTSNSNGTLFSLTSASNHARFLGYNSAGSATIDFKAGGDSYFNTGGNLGVGTTGPGYKLDVLSTSTTGGLQVVANSVTTGTGANFNFNGLTTGKGMYLSSTSTSLSSGSLFDLYWNPTANTTATGNLFNIGIGSSAAFTGKIFNIEDNGTDLFSVGTAAITSALPHEFTAGGDVTFANDIVLTNQSASLIGSYGPLTIEAGESFESNNLVLKTYN